MRSSYTPPTKAPPISGILVTKVFRPRFFPSPLLSHRVIRHTGDPRQTDAGRLLLFDIIHLTPLFLHLYV